MINCLESAAKMTATELPGQCVKVQLRRESESDVIFISCDELPELFVAVTSDDEIRDALDTSLKDAFSKEGRQVQVFTNCSVAGPRIDVMVHLTSAQ